jgi:hypothetical protein
MRVSYFLLSSYGNYGFNCESNVFVWQEKWLLGIQQAASIAPAREQRSDGGHANDVFSLPESDV